MPDESYPALFEVATDRSYPLGGRQKVTVGAGGEADITLEDASGDQLIFQLEAEDDRWFLRPLDGGMALSVNQTPVRLRTPLEHMAIVQAGSHVFVFIQHDDPSVSTTFAANQWLVGQMLEGVEDDAPLMETLPFAADFKADRGRPRGIADSPVPLELPGAIELPERQMLIGRDSSRADICLTDFRVSRVHAWISRTGKTATITDLRSANGTFVDGRPIDRPTVIHEGHRVQIGPYSLVFTGAALYPLRHDKDAQIVARDLVRRVPDRKNPGQMKVILDDVTLVIRPREFVCIVGPSGSGKSTLLSALSARRLPDEGVVLLNGENLYARFDALKQNLAVVPQRDVLHDVLPLHTALRYTAKMRLPADISKKDVDERITEMLDLVRLTDHRLTRIRQLSGGQAKRASWVNEAICNPSLIFLDEVTSGLDEQTDCEMMQLFRQMASGGKTIICVTHSVTYVEENCDLIVVLASGGVLAFVGSPKDALEYFDISRLGDVYQRLSERPPDEWKQRYRGSRFHKEYVQRRLPEKGAETTEKAYVAKRKKSRELVAFWRQFVLLTRRYLAVQLANKKALAMMVGQSLLIAGLFIWLFGDISKLDVPDVGETARQIAEAEGMSWAQVTEFPELELDKDYLAKAQELVDEVELAKRADYSSKLLFLLCISCIWFGCNNAAKEIVKERDIYNKERDVGLNVISYYGSKLTLLGGFSVLQASLLYWGVLSFTKLGGDVPEQWLLLSLASLTGVAMGLAISAIANTGDLAATIVPISLIPQIVFAGLIAPLLHYTREFSQFFISAYWAYQGLLGSLDTPVRDRLHEAENLDLDSVWTPTIICCILLAHVVVFAVLAISALYARDNQDSRLLRFIRRLRVP
ncbi:MAG: ATP-binding cassette domain-containing protein [Planctomycetes bacterium]|nr:ATP-binding cassette domain-containing protein [Planctomycetota bacterium]